MVKDSGARRAIGPNEHAAAEFDLVELDRETLEVALVSRRDEPKAAEPPRRVAGCGQESGAPRQASREPQRRQAPDGLHEFGALNGLESGKPATEMGAAEAKARRLASASNVRPTSIRA